MNDRIAGVTFQGLVPAIIARLKNGLDSFLVAIGTYVMQRFGALNLWLYAIHKSTRFRLVELVALFLLFPAFELSNFGFQLAYAAGQRRLIRVGAVQLGLQPEQHAVQFDHLG
ncbi:hypothetical protein N0374_34400, partial [Pseudomonas aeruginosa]|nr:hypothetical protein [Pseudomonas aeruginosa]